MSESTSFHLRLQQQIDCQLEVNARQSLINWESLGWNEEPGTDSDEAPLKYLALVLLDALESKAVRINIDKDNGSTVYADTTYTLPKAPTSFIARGLEILRDISGMEGASSKGRIAVGLRSESLEIVIQKDGGLHTITILY